MSYTLILFIFLEYLQIEGTPLVTTIEPEKDYIPLVKVEDNIELC